MKARIKQNAWGNWYGYLGTKKVASFANSPTETMEQQAQAWLKENTDLIPCSIVKVKYVGNDGKKRTVYLEKSKVIEKSLCPHCKHEHPKGPFGTHFSCTTKTDTDQWCQCSKKYTEYKFITGYAVDKHAEGITIKVKGGESDGLLGDVMHMIQLGEGVTVIPQLQSKTYGDLHDKA